MDDAARNRPWFVYVLRCEGDRLYCGITNDLDARWASHVAGKGARFTRAFPPLEHVASLACADRSAALREEAAFKRLTRPAKEARLAAWRAAVRDPGSATTSHNEYYV